ncbi:hypothetical protein ACFSCX_07720 [Bacillus salitolerans]|uniref:Uncharacterized protein n=1 Tax=Bacillus salitolerans TaxID=1437434 RepID=A0ABW4LQQ8_9BACI
MTHTKTEIQKKQTFLQTGGMIKILLLPFLLTLIFLSLVFWQNLSLERSLPSEGWSRTISLHGEVGMSPAFVYSDEAGIHIYSHNDHKVTHFNATDGLKVKNKTELPVKIPAMAPFWAKDNNVLFLQNHSIVFFNGEKEEVLLEGVDGFSTSSDKMMYWQDKRIYSLSTTTFEGTLVGESEFEIDSISVADESPSFLVLSDRTTRVLKATLFQHNNGTFTPTPLFTVDETGVEEFTGLDFIETDSDIHILYSTFSMAQQKRNYRTYFASLSKDQVQNGADFKEMHYYDDKTRERIRKPRYPELFLKDGQPTVLFSAEGSTVGKRTAVNIYEAVQVESNWLSERRSTSNSVSVEPAPINSENVIWLDFSGEQYAIVGSTTNEEAIAQSLKITDTDIKSASSATLTSVFTGFLMLFLSIMWIIFPTVFLTIIFFKDNELIEGKTKWVEYTSVALFVAAQLLFHEKLFNRSFYSLAPDYLTFSGSQYMIPILLGALCYVITMISHNREWGIVSKVSYFMGINILFIMILVGPYTL